MQSRHELYLLAQFVKSHSINSNNLNSAKHVISDERSSRLGSIPDSMLATRSSNCHLAKDKLDAKTVLETVYLQRRRVFISV